MDGFSLSEVLSSMRAGDLCSHWHIVHGSMMSFPLLVFLLLVQVRTLSGHTNEKNFVGLSVGPDYIACGSETNEVYVYYKVGLADGGDRTTQIHGLALF